MKAPTGFSGTLFPGRYLADALVRDAERLGCTRVDDHGIAARMASWWRRVSETCGPATSTRSLVDVVAMPLCGLLGFRARSLAFVGDEATVGLETRRGTTVALIVRPWASRPSARLRQTFSFARGIGAPWCIVLAPPFLSIVSVRGHATRRAVDIALPHVLSPPGRGVFLALARSDMFDPGAPHGHTPPLDALVAQASQFQDRVRRDLQSGVEAALTSIGEALAGGARRRLADGRDESLVVVYRILFLLFAESRDVVPHAYSIYSRAYAMSALCRAALDGDSRGTWDGLAATTRLARAGCHAAGLDATAFNGPLFARRSAPTIDGGRVIARPSRRSDARDDAARRALVALGSRPGAAGRETISYRDLGVEQLGGIYEQVLDLARGRHAGGADGTRRRQAHALARKETGTFYTPQPLADYLVRRTLGPLVEGASADDILRLRVVDPAMGSGAFLVASCHYLAHAYERALLDDGRASSTDFDEDARANIRRMIAERCLAGVDRNGTAVHLARLSLWLTTLARDKPLTFLDHRLRAGDSLTGAWPEDLRRPPGPRPRPAAELPLFDELDLAHALRAVSSPLETMLRGANDTVRDIRAKEAIWRRLSGDDSAVAPWRRALDLWCARWFWPPSSGAAPNASEWRALLAHVIDRDRALPRTWVADRLRGLAAVARAQAFFHWPLEFPDVFYEPDGTPRASAGFDAVIGNPPWEMLRADAGSGEPAAGGASPGTGARNNQSLTRFIRECGAYPSCQHGHLNLYQPFVDRALALARRGGRVGLVLPWGIASDEGTALLRRRLLDETRIDAVAGLDNASGLFAIHRGMRFLALTTSRGGPTREVRATFGITSRDELDALPEPGPETAAAFPVRLTTAQIETIGGEARRIPDVRRPAALGWMERVCATLPRVGAAHGWGARFGRELNATEVRPHLTRRGLVVIEGKHLRPFTVDTAATSRRLDRSAAERLLPARPFDRPRLAYRDVSAVGNRTTLIAAVVPPAVVTTHTLLCLRNPLPLARQQFLCGLFNSYVLNALVRSLIGGHVTTTVVEGLPAPAWRNDRVQRLIATLASRLAARWSSHDECRLQALVAGVYGLSVREFGDVLESFPLVPRAERDEALDLLTRRSRGRPQPVG